MKTGIGLSQELNLKLTMTPELQQSIHILQLSSYELRQFLNEQAMDNPMLDIEYTEPFCYSKKFGKASNPAYDPLWRVKEREQTLEGWLISQLRMTHLPEPLFTVASYLAGNLNDAGYLNISISETCAHFQLPKEVVEEALIKLQALDPAGIGARNLQDCLLLQIARDPEAKPQAKLIVSQYLLLMAQGKLDKIAALLGVTLAEVKELAAYIRGLNPRPGLAYGHSDCQYMIPDAVIDKEQGEYVVTMNHESMPRVSIHSVYETYAKDASCLQTAAFLKECSKSAHWVMRSVEQRKHTLLRVIRAIFEEQILFLEHGVQELRPLILRNIADKVELHESTVSRTVQNKYVKTPWGVFELKYFFSNGLQTSEGDFASIRKIKARIKELVASENKKKPFSDQKMVEELEKEGIRISRRTVTKYREEMRILSSAMRKSI